VDVITAIGVRFFVENRGLKNGWKFAGFWPLKRPAPTIKLQSRNCQKA